MTEEVISDPHLEIRPSRTERHKPFLNKALDALSSVRFGVSLLVFTVILSMIGMLVVQQNVQGFESFYNGLTPSEKMLFGALGFFDIYHTWYFNLLLLVLSLNIVLASIDRFPLAWSFIAKPKIEATKAYLLNQTHHKFNLNETPAQTSENVQNAFRQQRLKTRITEKNGRTIIFGQKNAWNRLGAYVVHVALLMLFLGHFVALQTGYDADIRLMPGMTTNEIQLLQYNLDKVGRVPVAMPFAVTCTDIEQKLVNPNGSISVANTLDWATRLRINDPDYGSRDVTVSLNNPYTYRGYRFFQASAITTGSARTMNLTLTPENGGAPMQIELPRNGSSALEDGTRIEYQAFFADFVMNGGKPDTRSADYNNPAVQIKVTAPNGEQKMMYAFNRDLPNGAPVGAPFGGYKYKLSGFEKAPLAHVLSIKYDPFYGATIAWYYGGGLLILSLLAVFFFAHQRVWAIIDENSADGTTNVIFGGNTNRNESAFEDTLKKIAEQITGVAMPESDEAD